MKTAKSIDQRMRALEESLDITIPADVCVVARLDGRNFSRLTRIVHRFQAPFDEQFRDHMVAVASRLMNCGFRTVYAYTQSDEISVLFHRKDETFQRRLEKWVSVIAGEASGCLSQRLGTAAAFDCRIAVMPDTAGIVEYFNWRANDAYRNALNGHCYWLLRRQGKGAEAATKALDQMTAAAKNELLFQHGINFNRLPAWQRRGTGLHWEEYTKQGRDPRTGLVTRAIRTRLMVDMELPKGRSYQEYLTTVCRHAE